MRYASYFIGGIIILAGLFFLLNQESNLVEISNLNSLTATITDLKKENPDLDAPLQKPLINPPSEINAIYFTGWSGGNERKINYLIDLARKTEINSVVLDIKDYSGYITYDINIPETEKYKSKEVKIAKINALIKKLHDEGIYVIGRISVFQDPVLANARPDLAIMSSSTGKIWLDNKELAWIDPAAKESWDYNIAIAKDAQNRGFDELNFDYIRFASDGNLNDMVFPFWDEITLKRYVIKDFFEYLRQNLPDAKLSADLFGIATIAKDFGVGQTLEDAFPYFDYIAPMVYPSHYARGFIGYQNPALYPYEVVKYSMEEALKRLKNYELKIKNEMASSTVATGTEVKLYSPELNVNIPKFRPWLQDFDLGADYTADMVRAQIQATHNAAVNMPEAIDGFMLWNPSNIYTEAALKGFVSP